MVNVVVRLWNEFDAVVDTELTPLLDIGFDASREMFEATRRQTQLMEDIRYPGALVSFTHFFSAHSHCSSSSLYLSFCAFPSFI
ncbi:hypothetical protein J6590_024252 [Homalodisca vitripennis]|nr:hypothetical protein J6590_024252 [Homalodisca vitripennis]